MTEITFSNDVTVKLIRASAADDYVIQAAQVSSKGENKPETVPQRLIDSLMFGRHGSPFEHTSFTFFVEAPIFVFREWQRHRISSFNEMSGRYTTLIPKFYVPGRERPMINVGTKMKPEMVPAGTDTFNRAEGHIERVCVSAWDAYTSILDDDIANEVARIVLPLNVYSQMYWTVNARSLMNFLSLRVESEDSLVKSYPQLEIQKGADVVEAAFAELMPATYSAFLRNGRVAP